MQLKLDDSGHVVVQDGKPVYLTEDGKEIAFDAVASTATNNRLLTESKTNKTRAQTAEDALKSFEGIDAKAAREAIEKVSAWGDKELVEIGKVETIKAEAIRAVEERYKPVTAERDKLKNDLYAERIGGQFARSKFITEKCAIPSDLVQARFEKHFKDEDGKPVAYDSTGNMIYSRERPGEAASFDEALSIIIDQYPYKENILKGSGGGSGAKPSGGSSPGSKTISQTEFNALSPAARATKMKEGFSVTE